MKLTIYVAGLVPIFGTMALYGLYPDHADDRWSVFWTPVLTLAIWLDGIWLGAQLARQWLAHPQPHQPQEVKQ